MDMTVTSTMKLKVDGMSCGGCVSAVKEALQNTPGVDSVEVDLLTKTARVRVSTAGLTPADLIKAVQLAGYTAKLAS